jgi:hypothetical protein
VLLMQIVILYALIRERHVLQLMTVPLVHVLLQERPVSPFTRVKKLVKHVLRMLIVKKLAGMSITALMFLILTRKILMVME